MNLRAITHLRSTETNMQENNHSGSNTERSNLCEPASQSTILAALREENERLTARIQQLEADRNRDLQEIKGLKSEVLAWVRKEFERDGPVLTDDELRRIAAGEPVGVPLESFIGNL